MALTNLLTPAKARVDGTITKQLEAARAQQSRYKTKWAECLAFYQGRQFVFRSATSNVVHELETREFGDKPEWRSRTARNRILGFVAGEVSAATGRIPQFEVTPTNTDPAVVNAARLSEKILTYLYGRLKLRRSLIDAVLYAVVCGEGFVRPFWNPTVGDKLPDTGDGKSLYTGELDHEALGPHEVFWKAGCRFEESPWHAIEKPWDLEKVKALPNFTGVGVEADVVAYESLLSGQLDKSSRKAGQVRVTEYLELPSRSNKDGVRLLIANGSLIQPPEPYPPTVCGAGGPEPCVHRLRYFPTPDRDRDMGLVEHMIDPQRTLNDSVNRAIEWKNLVLVPQILEPVGSLDQKPSSEPGARIKYRPVAGLKPEWRQVPSTPEGLFRMAEQAIEDMEEIAAQRTPPPQIDSGKSLATWVERDERRRAFILEEYADFLSGIGCHYLYLVQKFYTEPRLLQIEGRHGLEYIPDFKGADLKNQTSARVLPGSIEPMTRNAIQAKVMAYAQMGWVSPDQAMAAIEGGTAEGLVEGFELDVSKQDREIQQMIALGDEGLPGGDAPDAAPFDNHRVHLDSLHRWMKTVEWESSPEPVKAASLNHEAQHQQFIQQEQAQATAQQAQTAQQLGMANATRPTSTTLPSLPGGTPPPVTTGAQQAT